MRVAGIVQLFHDSYTPSVDEREIYKILRDRDKA